MDTKPYQENIMLMAYVNLDIGYFSHRKTVRLVGILGREAESLPIRLWCYCALHHEEDGRITDYKPEELEYHLNWRGAPGAAYEALMQLGFIERCDGEILVHDWEEHEGHLAAFKRRSKKANAARWGKIDPEVKVELNFSLEKWPTLAAYFEEWEDWVDYRKRVRKPYKTQRGIDTALKFLASQPDPLACIKQSIDNEWQGLFPLRTNGKTVKSDGFQYERLG